jgi:hypothetical protein
MEENPLRGCVIGEPKRKDVPHVAVIGDSHARILVPALEELADRGELTIELLSSGGCAWAVGRPNIQRDELRTRCESLKTRLFDLLQKDVKRYDFIVTSSVAGVIPGDTDEEQVRSLVKAWKPVTEQGVPVVAVRDNPHGGKSSAGNPNTCLAEVPVADANEKCALDRERSLDSTFDAYRPAVKQTTGAKFIDLTEYFCDEHTCPVVIGGVNVYRDHNHVTVSYMETMAPYLQRELVRLGLLKGE